MSEANKSAAHSGNAIKLAAFELRRAIEMIEEAHRKGCSSVVPSTMRAALAELELLAAATGSAQ